MEGKVIRIVEGEKFNTFLIWLKESGVCGRTYTGATYRNWESWRDIKVGDYIGGLAWKDEERKILDADSPVHLIQ